MATTTLTQPFLFEPQGTVVEVDGMLWYEVDMYRGSDTTDIQGVSWWTTDYCTAKVYAGGYGDMGIIMHRTVRLLVTEAILVSPCPYLIGGRGTHITDVENHVDSTDLEHYYYGLSYGSMGLHDVPHFDISIHSTILEHISVLVDVHVPRHVDVPSSKTITITL
jgi:hypothetical protein